MLFRLSTLNLNSTAAKASVDIALHDLVGKIRNKPCHELFGADKQKDLFTAYTIPMDDPKGILSRVEEAKEYKIIDNILEKRIILGEKPKTEDK